MGEKISRFKNLLKSIFLSVTKHKVILINTILAAVFGIIAVYLNSGDTFYDVSEKLFQAFLMATLFALPATYISEKFNTLNKYLIQAGASVLGGVICYCILEFVAEDSYITMYLLGIGFAVICATITIFVPKEDSKSYYANLVKNFMFSSLICFVGFLGTILLIYAFSSLIVEIESMDDLVQSFFIFWGVVIFINLFVFYLFEKRKEPSGKAFKIIFLYILFPIYGLLLLILYTYLFKALFTFSLPQGEINWFVSFATVFYLVFYFILCEYEDLKIIRLFYRFGALVLIPLVCIQWPAFFIRLTSYGFTGWRYSSLIYNIFSVIFIVFSFIKNGKYTKYAIPVLGVFILWTSVTPFNLIDVAYRSQYNRLVDVLERNDMFENGRLKENLPADINDTISKEDREQLISAHNYIRYTSDHERPEWMKLYSIKEIYNIDDEQSDDDLLEYKMNYLNDGDYVIDIEGYSKIEKREFNKYFVYDDLKKAYFPGTSIDISEFLLSLAASDVEFAYYQIDESTRAFVYNVKYSYNKVEKGFENYRFEYYLLRK